MYSFLFQVVYRVSLFPIIEICTETKATNSFIMNHLYTDAEESAWPVIQHTNTEASETSII